MPITAVLATALIVAVVAFLVVVGMLKESRLRYTGIRKNLTKLERWCEDNGYARMEPMGFLNSQLRFIGREEFIAKLNRDLGMDYTSGNKAQESMRHSQAEAAAQSVTETDAELTATALDMWANWIETGNVTLAADDAIACGSRAMVKLLTPEQRALVMRLRTLSQNVKALKDS